MKLRQAELTTVAFIKTIRGHSNESRKKTENCKALWMMIIMRRVISMYIDNFPVQRVTHVEPDCSI